MFIFFSDSFIRTYHPDLPLQLRARLIHVEVTAPRFRASKNTAHHSFMRLYCLEPLACPRADDWGWRRQRNEERSARRNRNNSHDPCFFFLWRGWLRYHNRKHTAANTANTASHECLCSPVSFSRKMCATVMLRHIAYGTHCAALEICGCRCNGRRSRRRRRSRSRSRRNRCRMKLRLQHHKETYHRKNTYHGAGHDPT